MLFIEYPKCSTCQKAKRWLQTEELIFHSRNIVTETPTAEELQMWLKLENIPVDKLWNTSGMKYRELNLKEKKETLTDKEKLDLLSSDGMLIKRPLVITQNKILIGFKEKEWKAHLKKEK